MYQNQLEALREIICFDTLAVILSVIITLKSICSTYIFLREINESHCTTCHRICHHTLSCRFNMIKLKKMYLFLSYRNVCSSET